MTTGPPPAHYRVAGDGPALLFLHGLGGDHTNWAPQLQALSERYCCISWTMPGYGDSPPLAELSWPALADAAVRVLDDAGVSRATVIGLSLGGYIAQQVALDHPARVEGLVLAATTSQFGPGNSAFATEFLASRLAPLDQGKSPADLAPEVVRGLLSPDTSQ